ncbi:helix-turn-helix domain-containing protein [Sandaracinobacter sp. RS1-74]|uniref:helix-turn-helix domain-containing protein n=1 Tax=Sandaracinobacteroides sayramensis TaxID=2913411 RepID=UPI001EDA1DB7|nr:helix-turn-helix domain-containing protein [Sandaracinobacteroides sayramensis]MCG2841812.1 helix-turn-helix domain-containing protein [Sandaracinobacteroides sayramensis]
MLDEYLTAAEAAVRLRLTEGSLRWMRCKGMGPPHSKKGKFVLYRGSDVEAYLAKSERGRTATNRCDP